MSFQNPYHPPPPKRIYNNPSNPQPHVVVHEVEDPYGNIFFVLPLDLPAVARARHRYELFDYHLRDIGEYSKGYVFMSPKEFDVCYRLLDEKFNHAKSPFDVWKPSDVWKSNFAEKLKTLTVETTDGINRKFRVAALTSEVGPLILYLVSKGLITDMVRPEDRRIKGVSEENMILSLFQMQYLESANPEVEYVFVDSGDKIIDINQ